ncbi:MAG: alpha-2-macroglobulin family protein, partial [Enterobacteriaceae bacterium]
IIAVDPKLQKMAPSALTLALIEQKSISVLTREASGVYRYQSRVKEIPLDKSALVLPAEGTTLPLVTDKPGNFVLLIQNSQGQVLNRISYSVAGAANISRSLDRNAELNVKLDKSTYEPGETAEISINAPYAGSGLITVERDKVYAWHWFKSDTTSSVQHITIPRNMEGNGYINVQWVRDSHSDEIFMSPLSYAVMPFAISTKGRQAAISLETPEVIKPGQDLTIKVNTDGSQRVVVFAVDEGILQVARYKLRDPLQHFFRKRELNVSSMQILDLILPEFSKLMSLASAAGGDAGEGLDLHLNPFKRKRDLPVAWWSGLTDVDEEQEFTYPVPDYFNGKIRVMAISVTPGRIGHTQTQTLVRDDLILSANVPAMVAPGDEFDLSVAIANNLPTAAGEKESVTLTVTPPPQLEMVGESTRSIELAAKSEGHLSFRVRARNELGDAPLQFSAHYRDGQSSSRRISTSVRPVTPYRMSSRMGRMSSNSETLTDLRRLYPAFARNQARVAHSPLVLSNGLANYLQDYPYTCSEQLVSRAVPLLLQKEHDEMRTQLSAEEVQQQLQTILSTLQSRQNGAGAFGMWRSMPDPDPFITPYVVQYLLEARQRGIPVSDSMLKSANEALKTLANGQMRNDQDLYTLRLRTFAIYLLTRQGELTTNQLASVQKSLQTWFPEQWQEDLAALYLASSYRMLKMDDEANRLLQPIWKGLSKQYDKAWWSHNYYDPLVMEATRLYLLASHFPELMTKVPPQVLENMVLTLQENRYTSHSAAMTILALERYSTQVQGQSDSDSLAVKVTRGQDNSAQEISVHEGLFTQGAVPLDSKEVLFSNHAAIPAWYVLTQSGFDQLPPDQIVAKGLEISRDYRDLQGNPVQEVVLGQKINVHVRIRANSDKALDNLAIVDLLPGGFEVVQQPPPAAEPEEGDEEEESNTQSSAWLSPLKVAGSSWDPDYTDIREDRVIIYGSASNEVQEFVYQIKSGNSGRFMIPPAYAESLYNRDIQALAPGAGYLTVKAAEE